MNSLKVIIGIIVVVGLVFILGKGEYEKTVQKNENANTDQAGILEVKANDWVIGSSTAKVTIVEYLDFECEACGAYYPIVNQLKEEYKDSLRLVIRHFPLAGHKNSRTSAYAVEAAGKQGKFWEMYDILYTKQNEWGESQITNQNIFEKYAVEAGLNIEQWKQDVKSDEVKEKINDSYSEAVSLNLQGTPSFFLNGKSIGLPRGYELFKKLIEEELKKY
jgi:protein-disulfide isomerase